MSFLCSISEGPVTKYNLLIATLYVTRKRVVWLYNA